MHLSDVFEIIVCMLAVYGIYALICRFISHGCYKGDLAVAFRPKDVAAVNDPQTVADGIRRARLMTEGQHGSMLPSVILLPVDVGQTDPDLLAALRAECEVYQKIS